MLVGADRVYGNCSRCISRCWRGMRYVLVRVHGVLVGVGDTPAPHHQHSRNDPHTLYSDIACSIRGGDPPSAETHTGSSVHTKGGVALHLLGDRLPLRMGTIGMQRICSEVAQINSLRLRSGLRARFAGQGR